MSTWLQNKAFLSWKLYGTWEEKRVVYHAKLLIYFIKINWILPLLTVAASIHLTHPVEGIRDQVGQSPIQVHRGQTALVPVPGRDQLRQIAVHALCHATDVQLPCKTDVLIQNAMIHNI